MAPKRKHCEPDRRLLEVSSPSPGAELQPLRGTSSLLVSPALNALTPQSTPAAILANEWNTYAPTFGLQLWNVNAQLPRHTLELVPLPPAFLQGILFRISMTWMAATRGALMRLRDLDGCAGAVASMFRGRILGTSKSRDPQHTQDLPFDPPVHAMFSLSAPAIPALIVLGVPPGLTRAERIASILSAFKHSATPPPGAAIHAVCTDGDVLEVYRLEGSTLSLAHDMAIEYGTPTAYARGMEQAANLVFTLLLDTHLAALRAGPKVHVEAALSRAEEARQLLLGSRDQNAYAAERAGAMATKALEDSLRLVQLGAA